MDAVIQNETGLEAKEVVDGSAQISQANSCLAQFIGPPCLKSRTNAASPSMDDWAAQIRSVWANVGTNTLELARIVFQARRAMRYGAWTRMWRSTELPFGISKAKMLVRIGEHLGDLDGQTCGRLPAGWSVLYSVSLLGAATVKRLIDDGLIHPGLTLRQAREYERTGNLPDCKNCNPYSTQTVSSGCAANVSVTSPATQVPGPPMVVSPKSVAPCTATAGAIESGPTMRACEAPM